jgi:ABC-type multidrug transport system permease subunit
MPTAFQWVIIVLIVSAIFVFVKFKYIKHKLTWIIILFLLLLFYVGFLASTSGQNIDFSSFEGSQTAIKLYLGWLGNSFDNMKTITGNAVNLDWGANTTTIKSSLGR